MAKELSLPDYSLIASSKLLNSNIYEMYLYYVNNFDYFQPW